VYILGGLECAHTFAYIAQLSFLKGIFHTRKRAVTIRSFTNLVTHPNVATLPSYLAANLSSLATKLSN
jgi:hypothetical protein